MNEDNAKLSKNERAEKGLQKKITRSYETGSFNKITKLSHSREVSQETQNNKSYNQMKSNTLKRSESSRIRPVGFAKENTKEESLKSYGSIKEIHSGNKTSEIVSTKDFQKNINERNAEHTTKQRNTNYNNQIKPYQNSNSISSGNMNEIKRSGTFSEFANKQYEKESYRNNAMISRQYGSTQFTNNDFGSKNFGSKNFGSNHFGSIALDQNKKRKIELEEGRKDPYTKKTSAVSESFSAYPSFSSFKHSESSKIINFDEPSKMSFGNIMEHITSKCEQELAEVGSAEYNKKLSLNEPLENLEYEQTKNNRSFQKTHDIEKNEPFYSEHLQRKESKTYELERHEQEENNHFTEGYPYMNRENSRSEQRNKYHYEKRNTGDAIKQHRLDETRDDAYRKYNSKSYEPYLETSDTNNLRTMPSRKGVDPKSNNEPERNFGILKVGSEIKLSRLQKTLSTEICRKLSQQYAAGIPISNKSEPMEKQDERLKEEKDNLYSDSKEWVYDYNDGPTYESNKNKYAEQNRLEHTHEERNYNNNENNIIEDDSHYYVDPNETNLIMNEKNYDDSKEIADSNYYGKESNYDFMNHEHGKVSDEQNNEEPDQNNRLIYHHNPNHNNNNNNNKESDPTQRSSFNNSCDRESEEMLLEEPKSMHDKFYEDNITESDNPKQNNAQMSLMEQDIFNEANDMFQNFTMEPNENQMYGMIDDPNMQSLIAEARKIEEGQMNECNEQQEQQDFLFDSQMMENYSMNNSENNKEPDCSSMHNEIPDVTNSKLSQEPIKLKIHESAKVEKEKRMNKKGGVVSNKGVGLMTKTNDIQKRGVAMRAKGVSPHTKPHVSPVSKTIRKEVKPVSSNQTPSSKVNRISRTNPSSISSKTNSTIEKRKVEAVSSGGVHKNANYTSMKKDVKHDSFSKRNVSNMSSSAGTQSTQELKKNRNDLVSMPSNISKSSNQRGTINAHPVNNQASAKRIITDSNKNKAKEVSNNEGRKQILANAAERLETQNKNMFHLTNQQKNELPTVNNSSGSTTAATRNLSSADTSGKGIVKSKVETKIKNAEKAKPRPFQNSNISQRSNVTESCRNRKNPPLVHTNAFKRSNTTVSSSIDCNKTSASSSIHRSPGTVSNVIKKPEGPTTVRKPGMCPTATSNKSSLTNMNKSSGNGNIKSGLSNSNKSSHMNKSSGNQHLVKGGTNAPTSANQNRMKTKTSGGAPASDNKPLSHGKEKNESLERKKENAVKGTFTKMKSKNLQDMHYSNSATKDVVNEEMKKYINSKTQKARSNSIPPNNKNKDNNKLKDDTKLYMHNEYNLIKHEQSASRSNKSNVLKKLNSNCNYNKLAMEKKNHASKQKTTAHSMHENESQGLGNNTHTSSDMVSHTIPSSDPKEKKEMSYFEWLAKEKKEKEIPVEKEVIESIEEADIANEENCSMLEPLSAFNLSQNEKKYEQNDFIVDRHPIGNGRTGLVFKAIIKNANEQVALKVMAKDTIESLNIEKQVLKEIIIQASLKHINILELLAYFEDKTRLFLILELANGGSIRNKMKLQSEPLREEEVALYVYQIADALSYLHQFNIIHRDLKPDNILIHYSDEYTDNKIYQYGVIKLADFGFSCQLKNKRQKRSTFCGTVDYMPPEIINQVPYDCNVDLWCLGIVIFELLVGFPPFSDDTQERIFDQIKELNFHFPKSVPPSAQELILKLCSRTAEERISAEDVKSHPWIQQYI